MSQTEQARQRLYDRSVPRDRRRQWFGMGAVPVAVYGLGKMGLPLAAVYAETCGNVVGVDVDETVVERVNRGESPIDTEPGLPSLVASAVETGALQATTHGDAAARRASVHVIIVPTVLTEDNTPDLSALRTVTRTIGSGLSAGDLVVVESTVPPGTCRDVVRPILEEESGLTVGDFGIAFCPERTSSGRAIRDIRGAYPKVVGGIDDESTRTAALIYDELTDNRVIPVSDITTAECVKVFEGVYRDVNIALANELARMGADLDVDTHEAIEVANSQPYCDIHDPGAGVGGHCIPFYPHFLMEAVGSDAPLLTTAREVNESMPTFAAEKLLEGLVGAGIDPQLATVAVLGVAYRPGVPETRASPAFPIIDRLSEAGVRPVGVDPVIDETDAPDVEVAAVDRLEALDPDGIVLVTAHEAFEAIDWAAFDDLVIVDGRDALSLGETDHAVYTIGGN